MLPGSLGFLLSKTGIAYVQVNVPALLLCTIVRHWLIDHVASYHIPYTLPPLRYHTPNQP